MRSFQRSLAILFGAFTLWHVSAPAKADNQQAAEPKPAVEITYRVYPKCTHNLQRTTYNMCGVDVTTIGKIDTQLTSVLPGRLSPGQPLHLTVKQTSVSTATLFKDYHRECASKHG
jgi:hypothetical protein